MNPNMLKITLVSSEIAALAKTGGLADAVSGLAKALTSLGNEVTLMMPFYRDVHVLPTGLISPLRLNVGGRQITYSIVEGIHQKMKVVLVDAPQYFQRSGIYGDSSGGYGDNDERFVFFTRACLEYYKRKGDYPDVFHCNDWPTGLFPLFLRTHYYHDELSKTPVLFTIHNIAYQGNFSGNRFSLLDIGNEFFNSESLEFYGGMSFLKSGLLYSDILTAVSPTYAKEILTAEFGHRMHGVLQARRERLFGVLNGIDEDIWNPEKDEQIVRKYDSSDLSGKDECRRKLLADSGFCEDDVRPIVCMIARFALQKGIDLIEEAAEGLMDLNVLFFVLGRGGRRYEEFFETLQQKHEDRVRVTIGFDEPLAHRLQAGSDISLMPSKQEPCGLNQMYSLKYGTVPVVHAVGGLDDTIQSWNSETKTGNGFKFLPYTSAALIETMQCALEVHRDASAWQKLMRNGMQSNFSWKNSALQYMALYDQAIQLKS
jgi:starch synthase